MGLDAAEETICRAIANQHRLTFMCGEEMCVVEPHQLGRDADGRLVLLGYLVEGDPEAAGAAHAGGERWRVYRVDDFYWALESSEPFDGPRAGYEPAPNGSIRIATCQL